MHVRVHTSHCAAPENVYILALPLNHRAQSSALTSAMQTVCIAMQFLVWAVQ